MKTGEIIMEYHTEGFIKEITVKDDATITFTLAPTEAFAFGKDESDGKKMILIKGEPKQEESPEAKLVALGVEFSFCLATKKADRKKTDRKVDLLYALKKDRSKVRLSASNVPRTVCPITSITIL